MADAVLEHEPITHEYRPDTEGREFVMVIAREESTTVDGRRFKSNSLDWREPPFPVLFTPVNQPMGKENGGHVGARVVAAVTEAWRDGGTIYGRGYFGTDELSQEAADMIDQGLISGVSADVGGAVYEELEADDTEEFGISRVITHGTIVSVTALPIQAFGEAKISVVASGSWAPPKAFFENPKLDKPTPLTVTADGRVYGHAAVWGTCHTAHRNQCVTPPRSKSGYQYFNVGQVYTDDGAMVNVGRLTAGTNHATLELNAQPAKEHYDNTGWVAAYVTAGEDEHGIWYSGAVSPTATEPQIATLRAGSVSGDWRQINGALDMVGMLTVNSPGFPVPRPAAGLVAGGQISLVASGIVMGDADCGCDDSPEETSSAVAELSVEEVVLPDDLAAEVETPDAPAASAKDLTSALRELDLQLFESDLEFDACCDGCSGKSKRGVKTRKYH